MPKIWAKLGQCLGNREAVPHQIIADLQRKHFAPRRNFAKDRVKFSGGPKSVRDSERQIKCIQQQITAQ